MVSGRLSIDLSIGVVWVERLLLIDSLSKNDGLDLYRYRCCPFNGFLPCGLDHLLLPQVA